MQKTIVKYSTKSNYSKQRLYDLLKSLPDGVYTIQVERDNDGKEKFRRFYFKFVLQAYLDAGWTKDEAHNFIKKKLEPKFKLKFLEVHEESTTTEFSTQDWANFVHQAISLTQQELGYHLPDIFESL